MQTKDSRVVLSMAFMCTLVVMYQILVIALKALGRLEWDWVIVLLPTILVSCSALMLILLSIMCGMILSGRASKQTEKIKNDQYYEGDE